MNSLPKTVTRQRRDCDLKLTAALKRFIKQLLRGYIVYHASEILQTSVYSCSVLSWDKRNSRLAVRHRDVVCVCGVEVSARRTVSMTISITDRCATRAL